MVDEHFEVFVFSLERQDSLYVIFSECLGFDSTPTGIIKEITVPVRMKVFKLRIL